MKWKTPYNAKPDQGEVNNDPSLTIPDEALSIQEILVRHARGLPTTGQRVPIYLGEDEEFPDPRKMDISEREALKKELKQEIKELTKPKPKPVENRPENPPAPSAGGEPTPPTK